MFKDRKYLVLMAALLTLSICEPLHAESDIHSVNFTLGFYWVTETCEITTDQVNDISDKALLSKTDLSGVPYFTKILTPTVAQKDSSSYVTNCIAKLPNKLIKGDFVACYSRDNPIRKYDKSLTTKATFIDEFCYSEPMDSGYYFEYRMETDHKDIAVDASKSGRCKYTCIVK